MAEADRTQDSIARTIRELFEKGVAAWNRGDLESYLAGYWDSERTRWAAGNAVIHGRQAIASAFRTRFPSPDQMGRIQTENLEIEVFTETDVLVFGHLTHTVADAVQKGFFTVHMRNIGGRWLVVSDHFSVHA